MINKLDEKKSVRVCICRFVAFGIKGWKVTYTILMKFLDKMFVYCFAETLISPVVCILVTQGYI